MDKLRTNSFGRAGANDAVLEGFYREADLEVEHHVTQSSKAQMGELVSGVWDIVHTNADNVFWWVEDNGADLLIVMATPGGAGQDLLVRPEIHGYEDLRGKVLAVDASLSGYVTPFRVLLREHGLEQEGRDFEFVEFGATQQRVDAMVADQAFGAMVGSAQSKEMTQQGFRVLDSIGRLFEHYAGSAAVRRDWAQSHRAVLVRYLRAHARAAQQEARAAGKAASPSPFSWEGLEEMLRMRQSVGLLRGAPDPHRFADDALYLEAVRGL